MTLPGDVNTRSFFIAELKRIASRRVVTVSLMSDLDCLCADSVMYATGVRFDPVFIRYVRVINSRFDRTSIHSGKTVVKRRLSAFASHRVIEDSRKVVSLTGKHGWGRKTAHPVLRFGRLIGDLFGYRSATMAVNSATPTDCFAVARGCSYSGKGC